MKLLRVAAVIVGAIPIIIWIARLSSQHKSLPHNPTPTPQPASIYEPRKICDNAFDQSFDFSESPLNHFSLKLQDGCFGGWVHLPKWWKNWDADATSDQIGYWIALWYDGEQAGRGPFYTNDRSTISHGTHDLFRLQGHGTVIFYTNEPSHKESGPE